MTLQSICGALTGVNEGELRRAVALVQEAKRRAKTIFFVGNGGSAAIASHMAADFLKNGHMRAMCFNDGALLTCLTNDIGYHAVFSNPLGLHGKEGDLLFAISSSGSSKNILDAVTVANAANMDVITLSGFDPNNPLRFLGRVNFHVDSDQYGTVEVCHHAICHTILDMVMHG